jgi:hypothetical protein
MKGEEVRRKEREGGRRRSLLPEETVVRELISMCGDLLKGRGEMGNRIRDKPKSTA